MYIMVVLNWAVT